MTLPCVCAGCFFLNSTKNGVFFAVVKKSKTYKWINFVIIEVWNWKIENMNRHRNCLCMHVRNRHTEVGINSLWSKSFVFYRLFFLISILFLRRTSWRDDFSRSKRVEDEVSQDHFNKWTIHLKSQELDEMGYSLFSGLSSAWIQIRLINTHAHTLYWALTWLGINMKSMPRELVQQWTR